jgi:hypothetical protein
MKTLNYFLLVSAIFFSVAVSAQQSGNVNSSDSTGLPGDNFSLQGALEMFKTATSLQDFEKKLNTKSNNVNNLDLDGDGKTDYIRVVDKMDGSSHAIIMQVAVNEKESQDIAVIELEKNGDKSAVLQITGDEELYGDSMIVEPYDASLENGKKGPSIINQNMKLIIVNVWMWPCVQFVYAPVYVVYASPWKWHYYPAWWSPWSPLLWRVHYKYAAAYHPFYRPVFIYRAAGAHGLYAPYRQTSVVVVNRYSSAHIQYKAARQARAQNGNKQMNNNPNKDPKQNNNNGVQKNNNQKKKGQRKNQKAARGKKGMKKGKR